MADPCDVTPESRMLIDGALVDAASAETFARRVRAGVLSVNGGMAHGADLPFGGYKQRGIGRQNGAAGFDQCRATMSLACPAH